MSCTSPSASVFLCPSFAGSLSNNCPLYGKKPDVVLAMTRILIGILWRSKRIRRRTYHFLAIIVMADGKTT